MKSILSLILIIFTLFSAEEFALAQRHDLPPFLVTPSGHFKIGVKEFFITDSSRFEKYDKGRSLRSLSVKIWYPSDSIFSGKGEMYLDSIPTKILYETFKVKGVRESFLDTIKQYKTHAFKSIPISKSKEQFPVLLFSSGYYFGMSELYTCLMENLASNGYIVCSITRPYEQPYYKKPNNDAILLNKPKTRLAYLQLLLDDKFRPKNLNTFQEKEKAIRKTLMKLSLFDKALKLWVDDTQYFIDYLFKEHSNDDEIFCKIDTSKIGIFGHSFGGSVAGQICNLDPRVKAGINIDCFQFGNVIDNPIKVPFMLIESFNYPTWNTGNDIIYSKRESDFYKLSIPNASHFVFSDASVLPYKNNADRLKFINVANGTKVIMTVNSYILDFFNLYLKNTNSEILNHQINNSDIKFDFNLN